MTHSSSDSRPAAPIAAIGLAVLAGLLTFLAHSSVEAGCPGSQLLDATFSYLVSNPSWGGAGGDGRCGQNGCYATESDPPVSPRMKGVYWAIGTGNPTIGVGNDSGLFSGGFDLAQFWPKQVSSAFAHGTGTPFPGGLYHYPAWVSLKLSPPYVTGPPVTWSSPDADGCGPGNPPDTVCTCILLTDEWAEAGYIAALSARSDPLGNTNIDPGQTIRLVPIPRPYLVSAARVLGSREWRVVVRLPSDGDLETPAGGVYSKDGCPSCLGGFRVFGAVVPRSTLPLQSQFVELPRADGTPQHDTPLDLTVEVRVDCDPALQHDIYLAIQLAGEGAAPFRTTVLSQASTRISCGSILATPGERRGDAPRAERGRARR